MLESNEQDVDLSTVPDKMQSFDVAGFGTLNGVTTQLCGGLIGRSLQTQFDMARLLTRAQSGQHATACMASAHVCFIACDAACRGDGT